MAAKNNMVHHGFKVFFHEETWEPLEDVFFFQRHELSIHLHSTGLSLVLGLQVVGVRIVGPRPPRAWLRRKAQVDTLSTCQLRRNLDLATGFFPFSRLTAGPALLALRRSEDLPSRSIRTGPPAPVAQSQRSVPRT